MNKSINGNLEVNKKNVNLTRAETMKHAKWEIILRDFGYTCTFIIQR